ncbi:unnamed protein product, partial [Ixodes hexagonus]
YVQLGVLRWAGSQQLGHNVVSVVEVREKSSEQCRLEHHEAGHDEREAAVVEERDGAVQHEREELRYLDLRDVLLPPQVWPQPRTERGQAVVGVHHHVHCRVEDGEHGHLARDAVVDVQPDGGQGHRVVQQVQEADVAVLLEQHKEHRVQQLAHLHEHVEPAVVKQRHGCRPAVGALAEEAVGAVAPQVRQLERQGEEVDAEQHHDHVVGDHERPDGEGPPVLHERRAQAQREVEVAGQDGHDDRWRAHQGPVSHPRVAPREQHGGQGVRRERGGHRVRHARLAQIGAPRFLYGDGPLPESMHPARRKPPRPGFPLFCRTRPAAIYRPFLGQCRYATLRRPASTPRPGAPLDCPRGRPAPPLPPSVCTPTGAGRATPTGRKWARGYLVEGPSVSLQPPLPGQMTWLGRM